MNYSNQQLKDIANLNPEELVKIINNHNLDIKTLSVAIELLSETKLEEGLILSILKRMMKHVHLLIRESAISSIASYYDMREMPLEIIDRLKVISKNDPSNQIRDYANDLLNSILKNK